PAVDLLGDEEIPLARRVLVAPIALYQQLSYATPLLNCQFEPSCSHFMALSISGHGVAQGMILGADRLVRCNPFAYGYQLRDRRSPFHHDGRLLDPVPATGEPWALRPGLTGAIIPGLGRARAGRPGDGVVSFLMVVSLAASANKLHLDGKQIRAGIMGTFAIIFWLADMRSAGLSQAMEAELHESALQDHVSR
ncbi:MAG: membrane protein insertion efficiency factor YidD, partial [Candidatus Marinimicrobia bacterium]|nr:membrane protein insertion efficiency factor YidD [Candidatus Neomarinimicrobiota bacterium]